MNKKSVIGTLTMIVLILIIFGALTMIVMYSWKFVNKQSDREICKLSLLASTKTKVLGAGDSVFRVDCKRHRVEIEYNDIKGPDRMVDEDKVYRILQEELYECYNMIPESLFTRNHIYSSGSQAVQDPWSEWSGEDNICLICSVIEFGDDVTGHTEGRTGKLSGFNTWLLKNPVAGQEKNIYGLMFGTETSQKNFVLAQKMDEENPIDTTKTYVIAVRWKAKGFFSDLKQGFYSSFGLASLPYWIKNFNSFQCFFKQDTDDPQCSGDFPIIAFLPVDNLGEKITFEEGDGTYTEEFCTVIWN